MPVPSDLYPIAVGNYWNYEETGYDDANPTASRIIGHEVVDYVEVDFEDDTDGALPVFVIEDTFPTGVGSDDPRLEYIYDDGTRVVRKSQEVYDQTTDALKKTRDYEPGLLRFDRGRTTLDDNWDEEYETHTVSDPPELDDGVRTVGYLYRVLEPSTVTVPAGTFDCFVLQRTEQFDTAEIKVYYFAPGIGKVKEITGDGSKTEDLVEYHVEIAADGGV